MMKYLEMNIKSKNRLIARCMPRFGNKYTKNQTKYKQIYRGQHPTSIIKKTISYSLDWQYIIP